MSPVVNSKLDHQRRHHHRQQQQQQQQQQRSGCHDDELSCKICLGGYGQRSPGQRPRTLNCQHTFCESCLQQLLTERRPQRKQAQASAGSVKCPLCKSRTTLGRTSIQGLPVNSTAIQNSSRMSAVRTQYRRELHGLQPRCTTTDTRKSMVHFMSYETTGSRVIVQRFESFHPRPLQDAEVDDSWPLTGSHRPTLRFADDNQTLRFADDNQSTSDVCCDRHDVEDTVDQEEEVFVDPSPVGVAVGQFGQYVDAPDGRPGTFRSPSSIDCARDGRLTIVDSDSGVVQIFARNGDCLSSFPVVGARAACFIADAARGESLAVVTNNGVSICDETGHVDKHLPVGTDIVAVAALRHGGGVFVAAHCNRLTICDRYQPSALLRSLGTVRPFSAPVGHPGMQFGQIVALATTATPRVYVVDAAAVLAVDIDSGTLLQTIPAAETRLLRQPSAVAVDLVTGGVFVCDATTRRVLQFEAEGGRYRCVAALPDDGSRCVALAAGPRGPGGHQMVYLVCRGYGTAQVHMYQI